MSQPASIAPADPGAAAARDDRAAGSLRAGYLRALGVAFAVFSSLRLVTYLPTLWAIHASGDSSQHSLWTWATWLGANATMAAWLYEHNGRRADRAVTVSAGNAVMCLAAVLLILWHRI